MDTPRVTIDRLGEVAEVDEERLRRTLILGLTAELDVPVEVALVVCDDASIAALNAEHLGHEGPTDVISFPQYDLTPGEPTDLPPGALLGDIVVSVDTATRQAADFPGWSPADELDLLALHGLLHLCGWDDRTAADRAAMQRREDELLTLVGLGPAPREEGA